MSLPTTTVAAATGEYNANLAAARVSGVAFNAFPERNNHGIVPLSLPPEGSFPSFERLCQRLPVTDSSGLSRELREQASDLPGHQVNKQPIHSVD